MKAVLYVGVDPRGPLSSRPQPGLRQGKSRVAYRTGTSSVTGVTATTAAPSLIRRAVGGVVGGREGRVTVRGSTVNLLQLAEETLRISVCQPCGASSRCLLSRRGRVS
jgi:hypothetical protein